MERTSAILKGEAVLYEGIYGEDYQDKPLPGHTRSRSKTGIHKELIFEGELKRRYASYGTRSKRLPRNQLGFINSSRLLLTT